MSTAAIIRPGADEHSAYFGKYIEKVPDGDIVALLRDQIADTRALLRRAGDQADFAYAPGKWTVKQVVGHLADVERVMAFRALWFARNDQTPLPGFDENKWVDDSDFASRTLDDLIDEFEVVRAATVQLASHLDARALARRGTMSGNPGTPRALLYIIAGHERHHVALFRERYHLR
ncbi:MAG TPA: DinB family protein [Gemmatimonadaceae bacterium]|nr:DinB family protein [Gemmatimonadaceae bacterium]